MPNLACSTPIWTTHWKRDVAVGADTGGSDEPDTKARKRLRELAAAAAALKGPRSDAKLKRLIPLLKELIDRRYHPIVFCRYIPTADYLAEHLGSALSKVKDLKIDAVTGTLPPEERETRVNTLSAHDGPVCSLQPTVSPRASTCKTASPRSSTTTSPGTPPGTSNAKDASTDSGSKLRPCAP